MQRSLRAVACVVASALAGAATSGVVFTTSAFAQAPAGAVAAPPDRVLAQLESWLASILDDRAARAAS